MEAGKYREIVTWESTRGHCQIERCSINESKKFYIVGASGFGREVLWFAERINAHTKTVDICGFIKVCCCSQLIRK